MLHATTRRLALLAASLLTLAVAPARAQIALGDAIPMADV